MSNISEIKELEPDKINIVCDGNDLKRRPAGYITKTSPGAIGHWSWVPAQEMYSQTSRTLRQIADILDRRNALEQGERPDTLKSYD